MKTFKQFRQDRSDALEFLDKIIYIKNETSYEMLHEGKWVAGRFPNNIRIDNPSYGAGQPHAHVYGIKGKEIGVVNFDGTASHSTKCKLNQRDADSLRARGFSIRDDLIVEWTETDQPTLLLENDNIIHFLLSLK